MSSIFAEALQADILETAKFAAESVPAMTWRYRGEKPHGWQDWTRYDSSIPGGKRFVRWAEPAPTDSSASRFLIAEDDHLEPGTAGRVVWVEISPNPNVFPYMSGGCFYSENGLAEECYAAAEAAVIRVRAKRAARGW